MKLEDNDKVVSAIKVAKDAIDQMHASEVVVTRIQSEFNRIPRYPTNIKGGYCGRCRYHYTECECRTPE